MKKILLITMLIFGNLSADLVKDGYDELIYSKNYEKAMELFTKACDTKNKEGCYAIGEMYYKGDGVDKDYSKTVKYYTKACEYGHNIACYTAGSMYETNIYNIEDKAKAVKVHTIGCDNGDMDNCNKLAKKYEYADGVNKNIQKAISLYKKACNKKNRHACNNLASMYEYGNEAISKNGNKALEYYKKGFEADGSYYNYFVIGSMYYKGEIIKQDLSEAKKVFTKLCKRVGKVDATFRSKNFVDSCFYLGKIYTSKVKGNKQDKVKAKELFVIACDRGNSQGCKEYKLLNEQGI